MQRMIKVGFVFVLLACLFFVSAGQVSAVTADTTDDFIITVKTNNEGVSSDTQFIIPTSIDDTYNYNVDCDGNGLYEATGVTGDYTCNYSTAGTYTIHIADNTGAGTGFPHFYMGADGTAKDQDKLIAIDQWGTGKWSSMVMAFQYCSELEVYAMDTPDLSNATSLFQMFTYASSVTGTYGNWDWNTSTITNMRNVFAYAWTFNGDVSGWDTSSVTTMMQMFVMNGSFNQDLSSWDVSSLESATNMFMYTTLSTENYDELLNSWGQQTLLSGVDFHGGNSNYCYAQHGRDLMESQGWTVTDAGMDCGGVDPFWSHEFGYGEGWEDPETPRLAADVDGDGIDDLIGFSANGVLVGLGDGVSFAPCSLWLGSFGSDPAAGSWSGTTTVRTAADVNGDGMADIVGFGDYGVLVSLSTGTSFGAPEYWIMGYGSDAAGGGWSTTNHNRVVADVNGDGMADVVGFSDYGVLVSLSTGTSFGAPEYWIMGYGSVIGGWDGVQNPRMIADINGDGCGDVVGFANYGVLASLSYACGTTPSNEFAFTNYWTYGYGYLLGGWDATKHIRTVADVNGDGYADVVGFGDFGVLVSLSDGDVNFDNDGYWVMGYGYVTGGWDVNQHPRMVSDVTGDGNSDIVGYATDGVLVACSDGTRFE